MSSASLRKLVIYCQGGCADLLNSKSISFDTPSLLYLVYSVFVAEDYPKVNLTNLVEAKFNLMLLDEQIEQIREPNDEDDVFLRLGNVLKLFAGIRNVQKLYLSANILEVSCYFVYYCSTFLASLKEYQLIRQPCLTF